MPNFLQETRKCWKDDILSKFVKCGFFTSEDVEFQISKSDKGYDVIFTQKLFEEVLRIAKEKKSVHLFRFLDLKAFFIPKQPQYIISCVNGEGDVTAIQHALAVTLCELCEEKCQRRKEKSEQRKARKEAKASYQKKRIRSEFSKIIGAQQALGVRRAIIGHKEGVGFTACIKCFLKSGGKDLYPLELADITPEGLISRLKDYVRYHNEE